MRKDKRDRQKRRKLIAELWKQLETPGISPETSLRITKQISKLELGTGPLSAEDKAAIKAARKDESGLPASWLNPDAKGVRWAVIYAVERLAGLPTPHPSALDAWIASLSPEEQAGLRAEAQKLMEPGSPPKPIASAQAPPAPITPVADNPIETEADAIRFWRGSPPQPSVPSIADFDSDVSAMPGTKR